MKSYVIFICLFLFGCGKSEVEVQQPPPSVYTYEILCPNDYIIRYSKDMITFKDTNVVGNWRLEFVDSFDTHKQFGLWKPLLTPATLTIFKNNKPVKSISGTNQNITIYY